MNIGNQQESVASMQEDRGSHHDGSVHHLSLDDPRSELESPSKRRKVSHGDIISHRVSESNDTKIIHNSSLQQAYKTLMGSEMFQGIISYLPYQQIVHGISLLNREMRSLCVGEVVFGSQYIYLNDRAAIPAVVRAFEASIIQLQLPAFKITHQLGPTDLISKYLRIIEPFVTDLDMTELNVTSPLPTDLNFSRLKNLRISSSSNVDLLGVFCKGDRSRFEKLELDSRGITTLPNEGFDRLRYANYGKLFIESIEKDLAKSSQLIELELPTVLDTKIFETVRIGCPLLKKMKIEISPLIAPEYVGSFPNLESLKLVCNLQSFQQFFADTHPKLQHLTLKIEQGTLAPPQDLSVNYITLNSLKMESNVPLFLFQSFNCEQIKELKLLDTQLPEYLANRFTQLRTAYLSFNCNSDTKSFIQGCKDTLTELYLKGSSSEELNLNNLCLAKNLRRLKLVSLNIKKPKEMLSTLRKQLPNLFSLEIDNNQIREICFESNPTTLDNIHWNTLHLESKQFSALSSSWFGNCKYLTKLVLLTPKQNTFWPVSEALSRSTTNQLESVQVSFTATRIHPYFCFYAMPEHVKHIEIQFSNKYDLREWLLLIICCHHSKRISFNSLDPKLITKSDHIPKKLLGTKYRKQLVKNQNFWSTYLSQLGQRLTDCLQNENMLALARDLKQQIQEEYSTIFSTATTENWLASPKILARESIVFSVRYMKQFVNHSMELEPTLTAATNMKSKNTAKKGGSVSKHRSATRKKKESISKASTS